MGFGVWGLGFRVWGLGFGVEGLGFRVWCCLFSCGGGFLFLLISEVVAVFFFVWAELALFLAGDLCHARSSHREHYF